MVRESIFLRICRQEQTGCTPSSPLSFFYIFYGMLVCVSAFLLGCSSCVIIHFPKGFDTCVQQYRGVCVCFLFLPPLVRSSKLLPVILQD
jgi:hypothetical protein